MRSSFHSPQKTAGTSSFLANGGNGAVAPISALKLLRVGMKRRRGEGNAYYDAPTNGREAVDANGNANDHNINENFKRGNDDLPLFPPSSSSSSPLCLMSNSFFSLPLGITELAGPAGVGKTQLALSLCADCVQQQQQHQEGKIYHQHNKNKAVFIQLGGSSRFLETASRRLEQMIRSRIIKDDGETETETTIHDCMTRLLVHWVCNSEELMELLQTSLPRLIGMHPTISVVVLDGIANLFRLLPEQQQQQNHRASNNSNPWHDRAVTFFQISNLCKELSSRFEIPFVVLNECTSRIQNVVAQHQQQKAVLEPALGLAWSQCVNCSFFVRRCESNDRIIDTSSSRNQYSNTGNKQQQQKSGCSRILQCLKAPHVSSESSTATFWIDRSGIIPI
jgi:RecA/RadA recombinase